MSEQEKQQMQEVARGIAELDREEFQYFKGYTDHMAYERRKREAMEKRNEEGR